MNGFKIFDPHLHAIVSDGCFLEDGSFRMAPGFMLEDLEEAFQYEVLKMLKKEDRINNAIIENMLSWHHSGFHVYIGDKIYPDDKTGLENLARYIVKKNQRYLHPVGLMSVFHFSNFLTQPIITTNPVFTHLLQ